MTGLLLLSLSLASASSEIAVKADCMDTRGDWTCFSGSRTFASIGERGALIDSSAPSYWIDRDGAVGSLAVLRYQAAAYSSHRDDRSFRVDGRLTRKVIFLRHDELKDRFEAAAPFLRTGDLRERLSAALTAMRSELSRIVVREERYIPPIGRVDIGGNTIYEDDKGKFIPEQVDARSLSPELTSRLSDLEQSIVPLLAEAESLARRVKSECKSGFSKRFRLPDRDSIYDRKAPALSVCVERSELRVGQAPRVRLEVANWLDHPIVVKDDAFKDPAVLARNSFEHEGLALIFEGPDGDWLGRPILDEKHPGPEPNEAVTIEADSFKAVPENGFVTLTGVVPRCPGSHRLRPYFEDCWKRVQNGSCYNRGGLFEVEINVSGEALKGARCPPAAAAQTFGQVLESWRAGLPD